MHHRVREHATVPTDVSNGFQHVTVFVTQPESGIRCNVQLSAGRVGQAVATCLVVRAGTVDRAVVLGDVEVDRPRPQRVRQLLERLLLLRRIGPIEIGWKDRIFWGVIAHQIQQRVGHVGLKTESFGMADSFQQINHVFPRVHAAPADFAFGRQTFVVFFGNVASGFKRIRNL